ncbi:MAG TPA: ATP-dependent Clp protease adapter ClpS [Candidatus Limnocylindria bacterium]|nr:ATP-dependent Clp protease adapter ClpS [Candidatus Limnocylindria bacterium]
MRHALDIPEPVVEPVTVAERVEDSGYLVICWDDPVNFMEYVTHVFQTVFGWDKAKAQKHMLEVHNQGRSVLTREGFEKAEFHVHCLQQYHLLATMERAE